MILLTLDNIFRHPLRWGRCPVSIGKVKVYGLSFERKYRIGNIGKQWILCFYFGSKVKIYSNYPVDY